MALGSNPYRKVFIDDMAKLQDLSVLAERAYIHLAFGQRSTACCLVRMKPDALRLELREHSRAKVTAALDELEAAGWVSIDRQTWTIALPVQSQRTPSENASVSQGKWKEAQKFPPSRQRDEVLDTIAQELARWEAQSKQRGKDGGETVHRTSNRSSNSNSIPIPIGIGAPAVAVDKPKREKVRPELEAAVAYFQEQGGTAVEAHKFCDYHDAGGWKIGRNPMKDWRAAARNWIRNATQYAAQGSRYAKPAPLGKLTGQDEIFSEAEMVKARKQMAEDTTPW
jgi:hypothetical protein